MKSLSAIYGFEAYFAGVIEYLKDRVNLFEEKIGEFDMSKLYGKPVEKAELGFPITTLNKLYVVTVTEKKVKVGRKQVVKKLYTINGSRVENLKLALSVLEGPPMLVEIDSDKNVTSTPVSRVSMDTLIKYSDFPLVPKTQIQSLSCSQLSWYLNTITCRLYLGDIYKKARELVDLELE